MQMVHKLPVSGVAHPRTSYYDLPNCNALVGTQVDRHAAKYCRRQARLDSALAGFKDGSEDACSTYPIPLRLFRMILIIELGRVVQRRRILLI